MSLLDVTRRDGVAHVAFVSTTGFTTLSQALAGALRDELGVLAGDPTLRCVVLTGAGKSFVVGADLNEIAALSAEENLAYNELLIEVNDLVAAMPVPVIAAVNGHAFGGGLELALACSIRVAATTARFGFPEVKVGLLPGSGGLVRLPRLLPRGAAITMLLTGNPIDAVEAYRLGLVDVLVATEEVEHSAGKLADAIAGNAPVAVRSVTDALRECDELPLSEAIRGVHDRLGVLVRSDDLHEGLTAFLEKRRPTFTGR